MLDTIDSASGEHVLRDGRTLRLLAAAFFGLVTILGLAITIDGLGSLRWAHLYRQKTGEGLAFVWVGAELLIGGIVAAVGSVGTLIVGLRSDGKTMVVGWIAVASVVTFLAGSCAFSFWVFSHGSRCIGPCG